MRTGILAACGFSLVALAHGQQPQPTFKGGVALVTIDVTVLDRDGKPVPGLTAEDFEVKLNGRVQPVRALTYLDVNAASPTTPLKGAVGPVFESTAPEAPAPGAGRSAATRTSRVFVILVDDLSFAPERGKALFAAAQRFVAGLPATDLVGFTTSSGAGAVNPTADRAVIQAALKTVVGQFSDPRALNIARGGGAATGGKGGPPPDQGVGISQALDIDRGDQGVLKDAIVAECFNGVTDVFTRQSLEQVIASNQCASDIQQQARRTAASTKETTARQVQAYQSVLSAMRVATGLKHLVLLTDGVGVSNDSATLAPVARAAAEAGVQLSVVIEEPDLNMSDTGRRTPSPSQGVKQIDMGMAQRRKEDDRIFVAGAQTVADMSGGTLYRVVGAPDPFFRRVEVASSAVYRLAVEPPADTAPGREFTLSARVRRAGLSAHANRHAIAAAPVAVAPAARASAAALVPAPVVAPVAAPPSPDERVRAAIASGGSLTGVPISLAHAIRRTPDGAQIDLEVHVEIPSGVKGPLSAILGLVDQTGTIKSGRKAIDVPSGGGNYQVLFSIPVAPGDYRLRFAVADAAGAVGAVESPVHAQFAAMGDFTASDLLLSSIDANDQEQFPAMADLPLTAKTLNAALELYPAPGTAPPPDLTVSLALLRAGSDDPVILLEGRPERKSGALRAGVQFPLEALAAGKYTVRATVTIGTTVVGTASSTVRKR